MGLDSFQKLEKHGNSKLGFLSSPSSDEFTRINLLLEILLHTLYYIASIDITWVCTYVSKR
jgi:hypothetical protein